MERLIIVNRTDDAPVNSRQWIDPAINKTMMMFFCEWDDEDHGFDDGVDEEDDRANNLCCTSLIA